MSDEAHPDGSALSKACWTHVGSSTRDPGTIGGVYTSNVVASTVVAKARGEKALYCMIDQFEMRVW